MAEYQCAGVQGQAVEGISLGAVLVVPGDGVAKVRRVDADLVFAAGGEGKIGLGVLLGAAEAVAGDLVVGDGQLAVARFNGGGVNLEGLLVLREPALDGALLFVQVPFQPGGVGALDDLLFPLALEYVLCALVLGEDNEARCPFVQTVDYPDFGGGAVRLPAAEEVLLPAHPGRYLNVRVQDGVQGLFPVSGLGAGAFGGGHGEEAGGFIDHYVIIVLKDDADAGLGDLFPGVFRCGAGDGYALGEDGDGIALFEGAVEGGGALAVHLDLPFGKHVPDAGFGLALKCVEEEL